jgi:hypothetical protein
VRGKGGISGEVREGAMGKEGEMTQTLYAHMNKIKIKKNKRNTQPQKKKNKIHLYI